MSDVLALFTFYLLVLPCGFIVLPLVEKIFSRFFLLHAGSHRNLPLLVPSLATGATLFLLFFSLWARLIPSYFISVPLAYGTLVLLGFLSEKFDGFKNDEPVIWSRTSNLVALVSLFFVHLYLLYLRSHFSNIHYDPGKFGAEKIYNLAFLQAFLFGEGYPPPNLWFAGEHNVYYILPKAFAGLASFFLREFSQLFLGAQLYHISDTFYFAFAVICLGAFGFTFLRMFSKARENSFLIMTAVVLAAYPVLSAPARAIYQAFSNTVEIWSLSRIIDNTVNEYPFWNFLWGDNHAHSAVMFMQLSLWFWLILFVVAETFNGIAISVFIGGTAAAVLLSHSGSVLINLVTMGAFVCAQLIYAQMQDRLVPFVKRFVLPVTFLLLFALPDILTRDQAAVVWYLVPPRLASKLSEFFNIHFVLAFALPLMLILSTIGLPKSQTQPRKWNILHLVFYVAATAAGYPVVGFSLLLAGCGTLLLAQNNPEDRKDLFLRSGALYAAALFAVWPEISATNFNMGDDYMRYNTLFRFLFESFYAVPLLWIFALAPIWRMPFEGAASRTFGRILLVASIAVLVFTQSKTYAHRVARLPQDQTLDGIAFLEKDRPSDFAIIKFLREQPKGIVIAEECGSPPKPGAYTVASRIATYSGRQGICGWSHHLSNMQSRLQNKNFTGQGPYANLLERDKWVISYFNQMSSTATADAAFAAAQKGFAILGVTHLIYGEYEREQHPNVDLNFASKLGQIVFEKDGTAVIALKGSSQ